MNLEQLEQIQDFCKNAKYFMVKYPNKDDSESGKILNNAELPTLDLTQNEIYRSTDNINDNKLLVVDLKPRDVQFVDNQLQLLINTLRNARAIELVYPNIFTWGFNGLNVVGYAIVPSNDIKSHGTITRYGGTENFMKILVQHIRNIIKLSNGESPDYDFYNLTVELPTEILSVGSINTKTNLYSIKINPMDKYNTVLKNSKQNISYDFPIRILKMKFWSHEINPDFISEAKHFKLKNPLPIFDGMYDLYPEPIKRLMNLPNKGNYNRFLLARFLLSVHSPKDAKFVYYSVLTPDELEHVKNGNCSTQWNYIQNNIDKYDCPSFKELSHFIDPRDEELEHPLDKIQAYLESKTKSITEEYKND